MPDKELIDNKNENIEILRAMAILLVIFVHIRVILIFPSSLYSRLTGIFDGNSGVDLFFAISGFVITKSLYRSFSTNGAGRLSLVFAFWIKRIFRLLPAALVGLMMVIIYLLVIGGLWDGQAFHWRNLIPIGAAFANVLNFYSAYCAANPSDMTWCNIYYFCGHYWSLSFEQQFYLVLPPLLLLFKKRVFIGLLVILIVAQFFWLRPYWSYGWFFRIDGFCWGALLAHFPLGGGHIPVADRILKNRTAGTVLSYGLIVLLPFLSCRLQGFGASATTYGVSTLALIAGVLIVLAVRYPENFGTWMPYRRIMLYIGSRSYSLYVTHLITNEIVRHIWMAFIGDKGFSEPEKKFVNMVIVIMALVFAVISAELLYRLIEVNFRFKGKELAKVFLTREPKKAIHV